TDHVREASVSTRETKRSGLASEKDRRVLRKSYLVAKRNRVLSPGHGYCVINDVGRRQPRLNVWIAGSCAECFEAIAEGYLRRILMACNSRNLRQLVRKLTVNSAAIELVILKTKCNVIH